MSFNTRPRIGILTSPAQRTGVSAQVTGFILRSKEKLRPFFFFQTQTRRGTPLEGDDLRKARLARMRALATGLLILMFAIFVVARICEVRSGRLGFIRAFAEAAMVGAFADWFAVVALFRHPLGIPIPHTAIIGKNKDRIGRMIADFVQSNFLSPEIIEQKLTRIEMTKTAVQWLARPPGNERVTTIILQTIPNVLHALNDQDLQNFVKKTVTPRLKGINFAPIVSKVLAKLATKQRGDQLFTSVVNVLTPLIAKNSKLIRKKLRAQIPLPDWWLLSSVKDGLSHWIADRIVAGFEETLNEAQSNPKHELRKQFRAKIQSLVESLGSSPDYREKVDSLKEEILANRALHMYFKSLWHDLKSDLQADVNDPTPELKRRITKGVSQLTETLSEDRVMQEKIDEWIRSFILTAVQQNRHEVGDIIVQTVKKWDARTTAQKLELQIGPDLQFIRINGTLVGGLVGLAIYGIGLFLH